MTATSSRTAAAADVEDTGPTTHAVTRQPHGAPGVLTARSHVGERHPASVANPPEPWRDVLEHGRHGRRERPS